MHDRGHKRKSAVQQEQHEQRRNNSRCQHDESDSSASSIQLEASPNFSITSHTALVFQARELVKALMHSHSSSLQKAGKLSRCTRNRLQEHAKDEMLERHLSRAELVKTRSLLKDLEILMEVPGVGAESHTASGRVAVSKLKAAIFGGAKTDRGLLDIVVVCTVEKARLFHSELVSLAKRCISSSNCFGMLALAHRLSLPELEVPATLFCVANFATAVRQAPSQLASLSVHSLVQVLQSSCLDVASESDVIDAVLLWLEEDPERRCEHLYDLLQGVRLEELGLLELGRLQQNPMIEENSSASALIASVYNQRMMNNITRSRQLDWPAQKHHAPAPASAVQPASLAAQLAARIEAAGPLPPHPISHHPAYTSHPSSHPHARRSSDDLHGRGNQAAALNSGHAAAGVQGGQGGELQQQLFKLQQSLFGLTPQQTSQQQQHQMMFPAHNTQSSSRGLGLGPELSAASLATLAGGGSEMFSSSRQSVEQLQHYLYADRQQQQSQQQLQQQQQQQQLQQSTTVNLTSQQELSSSLPLPPHLFQQTYHHILSGNLQPAIGLPNGSSLPSSAPSQQQQNRRSTSPSLQQPQPLQHMSASSTPMTLMLGTSAAAGSASGGGSFQWPHNTGIHSGSNNLFASSCGEIADTGSGGFASPFVSVPHGQTAFPQLSFAPPGNPHPTQSSPFASPFFALPGYNSSSNINNNNNNNNNSSSYSNNSSSPPTDPLPPLQLPLMSAGVIASLPSLQQQHPLLQRELSLSMSSMANLSLPPFPQQHSISFNVAQGTQQHQSSSHNAPQGDSAPGGAAGLLQAMGLAPAPIRLSLSSPPKQKDPLRTAAFLGLLST